MNPVGIAIAAIGNREWGSGWLKVLGHAIGAIMMGLGLWIRHPGVELYGLPAFILGAFIWRVFSPRPWFATFQTGEWGPAYLRALLVLPLTAISVFLTHSWWPAAFGAVAIGLVPVNYWFAAKVIAPWTEKNLKMTQPFDYVACAEFMNGALIGTV